MNSRLQETLKYSSTLMIVAADQLLEPPPPPPHGKYWTGQTSLVEVKPLWVVAFNLYSWAYLRQVIKHFKAKSLSSPLYLLAAVGRPADFIIPCWQVETCFEHKTRPCRLVIWFPSISEIRSGAWHIRCDLTCLFLCSIVRFLTILIKFKNRLFSY